MNEDLERVYQKLEAFCRERDYAGHDPFDALNSRLFQATPLRRSRLARLAWTQMFKRSPVSLRRPALVPAGRNAKGLALFALAALSRVRAGCGAEYEAEARRLLDALLGARVESRSGRAWGYNFDWQGRAFFAPVGTPTVVPTAFAVRALTEAAEVISDEYLPAAREACDFILRDLNRSGEGEEELCFSYTPLDRTRVFNASLLAAEALAAVGALTGERELSSEARRAVRYVIARQRGEGSWAYGADSYQSWADNFHTAFILTSLARARRALAGTGTLARDAESHIRFVASRGYRFWRDRFFHADGWPKYYHDRSFPADAHSASAAVVAFSELDSEEPDADALAERVTRWAVNNLYDARGFFYYQRRRFYTVRTPYMRWSQAWMLYALARRIEEGGKGERGNGGREKRGKGEEGKRDR